MTEDQNKVTYYEGYQEITCPVCGSNNWKLFKHDSSDEYKGIGIIGGFRVACANGCFVDNVNWVKKEDTAFSVIKTAFQLIEDDRK